MARLDSLEAALVSFDGLLDAHEVSVRARAEVLRSEVARVAAQFAEAELALEHVEITRATLTAVLTGNDVFDVQTQGAAGPRRGGTGPSLVPEWRADLTEAHLPVGYRDLWRTVAAAPEPMRAQQLAAVLGLQVTAAKVEGLRSKLKRLVTRGWIAEPAPGAFARTSTGPLRQAAGHD